ncbi:MAG: Ig domain-containing protein [Coprobacillaceae bacterium]
MKSTIMKKSKVFFVALFLLMMGVFNNTAQWEVHADSEQWNSIITNIELLEQYAKEYKETTGSTQTVDLLMLNYIRSGKYTGTTWDALTGSVDVNFASYVTSQNADVATLKTVGDIVTPSGETIDFVHMFATMAAIENGDNVNGDVGGWAGDYVTLCKDVLSSGVDKTNYDAVYAKAEELFLSNTSSFGAADWRSDLDGFLIMNERDTTSETFANIINDYYNEITEARRVYYFSNIRFPGEQTEIGYRSRMNAAITSNTLLTLLFMTNGVSGAGNATLREAVQHVVADYLYGYVSINEVSSITKDSTEDIVLPVTGTSTVGYTIAPTTAINQNVTITSSDTNIVTVTNGIIQGINPGNATLTITSNNGVSETINITVSNIEVTLEANTTITLSESKALEYEISPSTAISSTAVTFTSSDENIVSVDNNGVITGVSPGTATITLNTDRGVQKEIVVTVLNTYIVSFYYGEFGITLDENQNETNIITYNGIEGEVFTSPKAPIITDDNYEFKYWIVVDTNQIVEEFPSVFTGNSTLLEYQAVYSKKVKAPTITPNDDTNNSTNTSNNVSNISNVNKTGDNTTFTSLLLSIMGSMFILITLLKRKTEKDQ